MTSKCIFNMLIKLKYTWKQLNMSFWSILIIFNCMIWATEAIFYKIQCYMIYHNHNDHLKTYGIYVSSSKLLKKRRIHYAF